MLKKLIRPSGFKLGLLITVFFCLMKLNVFFFEEAPAFRFVQNIENALLDLKFLIRGGPDTPEEQSEFQKTSQVVIVAIDEKSMRMKDLGMWPWPRAQIAKLVGQLQRCAAKVVGFDVVFAEPDSTRVVPVVQDIQDRYARLETKDQAFEHELEQVLEQSDGDRILARELQAHQNVVLGYFFFITEDEVEKLDQEEIREGRERIGYGTISYVAKYPGTDVAAAFPRALGVRANLPVLTEAVERYGYFNQLPDSDRIYRRVPMVFAFEGDVYPALSLQVLSAYYHQPVELLVNTLTKREYIPGYVGLFIGPSGMPGDDHIRIPVETGGLFRVNFYGRQKTFQHVSAGDLIHGEPAACSAVSGKVVLVGATTIGIYDLRPTPFEPSFPGVEIHASVIQNVITKNFMSRPVTFAAWEALFVLLAGVFLSWLLNRFRLTLGLVVTGVLFLGLGVVDFVFLFQNGIQAHLVVPELQLVALFLGVTVYRYATEEREKSKIRHAFQFYLSKSVIDIMLQDTSKLKLGGERRELTVLFSDIRGFTTISERLDPEALTELLNEYLTPMTEIVFRHNGTLDKYMGDAIMTIFGAPVRFEDHARAACQTALDMMEELGRLRLGWKERGLPQLDIGIGINTGPMSVGNMGSANRFDYTVVGDHVNLGSRLEGLNKQFGTHIIVSEFTRAAAADQFTFRELDAVLVIGKREPVRIFELLHAGPPDPVPDAWLETFHRGLAAYQSRSWDEAIGLFQELTSDEVSRMYIGRCREIKKNPPGPDWDGVFKMTTK